MSPGTQAHNLPWMRTSFVGRDDELTSLHHLVGTAPVLTLVGPGGVGKTRLAVELAHQLLPRFPGGIRLADLTPLSSVPSVAAEIAALVGVTPGSGDPISLLVEQLGDRRVLLVLDNCEHLVEPVARLVHRIVSTCRQVQVLASSREPLAIAAEVTFPVPPLETAGHAVQLFVDRAVAVDPSFSVQGVEADVESICRRLDGVPLAIELAAPWVRVVTPAELRQRLTARFEILAATRRDLPARQRTMRATVEWSHQLLTGPQQLLFRRLAIFTGTFDLAAAERVVGFAPLCPGEVGTVVAELCDRSMLVVERTHSGGSRYRLLETLRDYATERLEDARENTECRARHLAYYLSVAERVDRGRTRTGSDAEISTLVPDGENYRAALSWSAEHEPAAALRLAAALEGFWMIRSVAEGRTWLQLLLGRVPEPTPVRARALVVAPLVVAGGLPWAQARAMIETSIGIFEAAGHDTDAAMARLTLALSAFFHGELAEAEQGVDEALRRHDGAVTVPLFRARAHTYRGAALSFTAWRRDDGRRLLAEGEDRSRAIGDGWGSGLARTLRGLAALRAGYPQQAREHLRTALQHTMQAGVTATAVGGLGQLALNDDPRRALTLLDAATAVRERTGVPHFPVHIGRQLDRARQAALRRMPRHVAERCHARARAMTTDEAIAYALADALPSGAPAEVLTPRQQEVALLVAEGMSNREIAAQLQLSVRTVETHVNTVLTRLGLHSRVQLAGWVRDAGMRERVT